MKEPTKEEAKRFWEWCGARCIKCNHLISVTIKQDMCCCHSYELDLDLNNLFKYAVPKLWNITDVKINQDSLNVWWNEKNNGKWTWCILYFPNTGNKEEDNYCHAWVGEDKDPALALFWAIYKVIEDER